MPNDTLQSINFTPESEPGKGDGQGWRLHKDGTVEISEALIEAAMIRPSNISSDTVQAFREKHLGKPFHRAIDRAIANEKLKDSVLGTVGEGDYTASITVQELKVEMPGGTVKIGNLEEGFQLKLGTQRDVFSDDKVRLTHYSNETMAKVANATQSLEQLVSHHNRMIDEVAAIMGQDLSLRSMARDHLRTGEALLRELLRKVDTRDVDDGK